MARRPSIRTKPIDIATYWTRPENRRRGDNWPVSIDDVGCFACGGSGRVDETAPNSEQWAKACLQRAHLVAHELGGKDEPANLVMLCWVCHRDAPDVGEAEAMLRWIEDHESQMRRLARELVPRFERAITPQRAQLLELVGWKAYRALLDGRRTLMTRNTYDNMAAAVEASLRDLEACFV